MKLKKINFRKFCHCGSDAGTKSGARSLRTRLHYTTAALMLTGTFYSASAMAQVSWTGGANDGLWGTAGNWSTNLVPTGTSTVTNTTTNLINVNNGGAFGTFVDNGELELTGGTFSGGLANSTLQVNNILALDGGALANVEVLAPNNGSSVVIYNNGSNALSNVVFDAGTNIDMAAQPNAFVSVQGNTEFNGTTNMAAGSHINIYAGSGTASLSVGGTLQGAGLIDQSYGGTLVNTGTIDANVNGQTLTLQSAPFTNSGTLEATKGGILLVNTNTSSSGTLSADGIGSQLQLSAMTLTVNGSDHISATNGGMVVLDGATITSGTLNVASSSSLTVADNASNSLTGVTVNGNLDMASQVKAYTVVQGATIFNGTTNMASGSHINIYAGAGTTTLTNNGTLQGAGLIDQSYGGTLVNTGTIDVNVSGQTLTLQPTSITNSGTLEATKGGVLLVNANTTDSGTISADGVGSQVQLSGMTLTTNPTDMLSATNGGSLLLNGSTITSGTVYITNGSLTISNNSGNSLTNLTVHGNLDMATQTNAYTNVQGNTTFSNNSTTTMAAGANIQIYAGAGTTTLTNDGIIQGAGSINQSYGGNLNNNGTINSDVYGQTFTVQPAALNNTHVVEATNGGVIALLANTTDSGTISADGAGSQVQLTGMTLTTNPTDTLSATNGGSVLLNGSTITSGTVNITNGSLTITNNSGNNLTNLTVNGNLDMATQTNAYTNIQGITTFSNNSTTTMAAGANIQIYAGAGATTLTNDGTIQGAGSINQSYGGAFTNNGTIDANVYGQTLLETVNSFTNTGNLNASNGGTLTVQNAGVVGGDVNATTGSTVNLPNGIIQTGGTSTIDGSLNTSAGNFTLGGGTLKGTGSINMSVIQTGGTFNPGSDPTSMNLTGNLSISGGTYQLDLASLSSFDTLNVSGTTNISGGNLYLDFLGGYHPLLHNSYQFLSSSFTPGQTGFSSITSDLTGYGFSYNNGIVTVGSVPPPAVPEASSVLSLMTMLGIGGAGFASNRRKSSRKLASTN